MTQSLLNMDDADYAEFFIHDVWTHLIYPQMDIPSLFAWRRVCRASYHALTRQAFWRHRLLLGKPTGRCTSSMRAGELHELCVQFTMYRSRLASILNVLFQRHPPAWYAAKRRGFLLHSSRERARVHKVAAVLGLYARTFVSGGVHVYHRTVMSHDNGYDTEIEGNTDFKAMQEMGVVVYWDPAHVPPYDYAPPNEERAVLVQESHHWYAAQSTCWSRTYGRVKADVKSEALLHLHEQKGQGLNAWLDLFAAAQLVDDTPLVWHGGWK